MLEWATNHDLCEEWIAAAECRMAAGSTTVKQISLTKVNIKFSLVAGQTPCVLTERESACFPPGRLCGSMAAGTRPQGSAEGRERVRVKVNVDAEAVTIR